MIKSQGGYANAGHEIGDDAGPGRSHAAEARYHGHIEYDVCRRTRCGQDGSGPVVSGSHEFTANCVEKKMERHAKEEDAEHRHRPCVSATEHRFQEQCGGSAEHDGCSPSRKCKYVEHGL